MYMISDKTKKNIERVIGLPLERLNVMTIAEERTWIEQKNKSPLKFSKRRRYGFVGRGNPLIARRKIKTFEDLRKKRRSFLGL